MVRNDQFFLRKWVEYYGNELGPENLYIFFDGLDQKIPDYCAGTNSKAVEKIGGNVVAAEKERLKFVSNEAKRLLNDYDIIIGGDADEYLVPDPKYGKSLRQFVSDLNIKTTVSGLGLDFGQMIGKETDLTLEEPFLSQRRYAQIGTRYTKASIVNRPCDWGSGFHRVKGKNFHIVEGLYLMHFGYSDLRIIEERFKDTDRLSQGWGKHINKRKRVIKLVNFLPIRKFDAVVKWARLIESVVRPPYAWNKPGLLGLKIIVELPERFKTLL